MKLGKLFKVVATGYALYKANEEEIDAAYKLAKKQVKKIKGKKKGLDTANDVDKLA